MSEACELLHQELSHMPRLGGGFDARQVPASGIYVMFERGEQAHGLDRITRVRSHSGRHGSLAQRLAEHYAKQNKDRSIFRKHIGRCILAARGDPFLARWNLDLTSRAKREQYGRLVDQNRLASVEQEVTKYITENLTFVVLSIPERTERLMLEHVLLATIACCDECHASDHWLGNFHPDERVRRQGLWNIQGTNGNPLDVAGVRSLLTMTGPEMAG